MTPVTSKATRLVPVTIVGPAGPLEGLLQTRDDERPETVALVCHPHPSYGGTLHNKVVHRAASTLHAHGAEVLRFNFRGVGASAGSYDEGRGELEDARAALEWLEQRRPQARVWVAGFSFGSWIAALLAAPRREVERLVLIAPPIRRSSFDVLAGPHPPLLAIQGTADTVCPIAELEAVFPTWSDPKRLVRVEGASHFFDRMLDRLAAALDSGLRAEHDAP